MIILRKNFIAAGIEITPAPKPDKEQVCCDLVVGQAYMEPGASTPYELQQPYRLRAGECIVVRTREQFTIPDNIIGLLCSKGSLSACGLTVPNTKVDPLFGGKLDITVTNTSRFPAMITPGMPFCSIIFYQLQSETGSSQIRTAPDLEGTRRNFFARVWARHSEQIVAGAVTFVISVGGAGLATYITITLTARNQ